MTRLTLWGRIHVATGERPQEFHRAAAAALFNKAYKDVTYAEREYAKLYTHTAQVRGDGSPELLALRRLAGLKS